MSCGSEDSKSERLPSVVSRRFTGRAPVLRTARSRPVFWTFGSVDLDPSGFYSAPRAGSGRLSKMRITHRLPGRPFAKARAHGVGRSHEPGRPASGAPDRDVTPTAAGYRRRRRGLGRHASVSGKTAEASSSPRASAHGLRASRVLRRALSTPGCRRRPRSGWISTMHRTFEQNGTARFLKHQARPPGIAASAWRPQRGTPPS